MKCQAHRWYKLAPCHPANCCWKQLPHCWQLFSYVPNQQMSKLSSWGKLKKAMMGVSSPSSHDHCFTVIVSITCCHTVPIKWSHQAARCKLKTIPKVNKCKTAFQANTVQIEKKEWKKNVSIRFLQGLHFFQFRVYFKGSYMMIHCIRKCYSGYLYAGVWKPFLKKNVKS